MHSKKSILSARAYIDAKKAMLSACILFGLSNVFLHIADVTTAEAMGANIFFLWLAFCIMRLGTYSTVSLVVIGDGKIQVFDGMLHDLGTYCLVRLFDFY